MTLPVGTAQLMKLLSFIGLASGIFLLTYVVLSTPTGTAKRLGLRGLKRRRALENVPLWATLEPVIRWFGARFQPLVSETWRARVNAQIALAGDYLGLLPEETIGLGIVSTILGLVAGWAFGWFSGMGSILVIGGGLLGAVLPHLQISSAAADRMKNVSRRLPYAIDLLALAMGAGLDFPGAVRQVVEKSGSPDEPVVEEFTLLLQSLQLGRTRMQALEEFALRVPIASVVEFVGAVVQAELRGTPLVEVLRIQAEVSRRQRSVRAEEAASKAGVKMIGPLVLIFVAILILIVAPIVMNISASGF